MQKWKHLIRFDPNEFGTLIPSEQSMYLQWLGSSLILSTYAQLSVKKVKKINIVIRGPHIKEAPFFHYKKGVVTHSLGYCAGKNGHTIAQILEPQEVCSFSFNALRKKWGKHLFNLCFQAKKRIEALPFPWFKEIDVVVHWNVERAPIRGTTATEDAAYWERVIDCLQISMERLVSVLEFRIPTITNELSETDFKRYYSSCACSQVGDAFKLMYFFMDENLAPSTLDEQLKGLQAPVCFSDNQYPDEKPLLQCWCRHIEREAANVRLAYFRELFLKRMATILERKCNKNVGVSMTFELEEHHCSEVFFPTLTRLITEEIPNAIKALISLRRKKSLPRNAAVSSRAIPLSYPNGYISNKFLKYFSEVIVTYAHPRRNINSLLTEYDCDEGVLRIFFFNDVIPCEFDILTAITEKLALHLQGRAEHHLLSFIRENESQLRTYMPSSSLRVKFNLPRNNEEDNAEATNSTSDAEGIRATQIVHQVLLGYHLLYHDHSVYALSPLLEALRSLSNDKRIKSDKLSRIKEVIVRIGTDQWSSVSFNETRNALVYFVSLRTEEILPSTIKVLSAEEIAGSIKAEMNMN